MPKITIAITTFKREDKLIDCVNSILDQSFQDFQILIGNDDPNKKISTEQNIFNNSKIKIINNTENLGERDNMNNLLDQSSSEYFTWLSDDDLLYPSFFEETLKSFENDNDIIVSYTNYTIEKRTDNEKGNFIILNQNEFLEKFLSKNIRLIGVYGLFKTKYLKKVGGMQVTSKSLENSERKSIGMYPYADLMLPIEISKLGKITYTSKNLVYYEISGSRSFSTKDFDTHIKCEVDIKNSVNKIIEKNDFSYKKKLNLDYYLAKWFYINQMSILKRLEKKTFQKYYLTIKIIFRYTFDLNLRNKIRFIKSLLL